MKMALVATIDSLLEPIVGFSNGQSPTVIAQVAVAAAAQSRIFLKEPFPSVFPGPADGARLRPNVRLRSACSPEAVGPTPGV